MTSSLSQNDWRNRIPKVELHLHLEGAIPLEALWALVQKYGGDASLPDQEALNRHFAYRDFPHFIETWVWKNQFLREYEDFTWIAAAVARHLHQQNYRYAETFYSPPDFTRQGLQPQLLTEAIRKGLNSVPEVKVALVADVVRDFPPENALRLLQELAEVQQFGVIGIGLGGSENEHPAEKFTAVFERARQMGFHTTAHAGEVAGADSIWAALRNLHAGRIGHATRAFEDDALLDYLAEKQVPLEMCPFSNLRTGVVKSIAAHPIRNYFQRGMLVTLNTDDPAMFGNSLAQEMQALEQQLGFSQSEIQSLLLNGLCASWLPAEEKQRLLKEFQSHPAWNENGGEQNTSPRQGSVV